MQLTRCGVAPSVGVALPSWPRAGDARARQVAEFDTSHSVFYEAPTRTHMFVYSPSGDVQASPWRGSTCAAAGRPTSCRGASVADQGRPGLRGDPRRRRRHHGERARLSQPGRGEATLKGDDDLAHRRLRLLDRARLPVELVSRQRAHRRLQHNTQFELSYARNFDSVCDRVQTASETSPTRWTALEDSTGCFTSDPDAHDPRQSTSTPTRRAGPSPGRPWSRRSSRTPRSCSTASRATLPQHRPRRRAEGAGARPERPRARGGHGARRVVPAPDPRGAAPLAPRLLRHLGHEERHRPRSSSRSPSASRCA